MRSHIPKSVLVTASVSAVLCIVAPFVVGGSRAPGMVLSPSERASISGGQSCLVARVTCTGADQLCSSNPLTNLCYVDQGNIQGEVGAINTVSCYNGGTNTQCCYPSFTPRCE
jgi:hypothetical protein